MTNLSKPNVVLHIISGLSTGGAEMALYNLLSGGLATRFDSHVISLRAGGAMRERIKSLGVPVSTLGMVGARSSLAALGLSRRIVAEIKPDVIQGWMYHGNLAATMACAFAKERTALVWNIRHSLYRLSNEKLLTRHVIRMNRMLAGRANAILYNSHLSRKQHEAFGFSLRNGQVAANGIDLQRFSFSRALRDRVRSDLGIPASAAVIGHVGRLHPMKDHRVFLRVAAELSLRFPEAYFVLSGRDVALDNAAIAQLIPVELRDRFRLLGEREDVPELMSAMDVFCMSSAWGEAFPNVIGEAMASGVPCVATDVGDSAMIIGDTGTVVPPKDEKALLVAIGELLTMPAEDRQALGVAARARVERNYALQASVDQYTALYHSLVLDGAARAADQ